MIDAPELTPVSLITGFLGSGKTTLLNRLLHHPEMARTAVVINEFGEIGLDHALVESAKDDIVLMASGCLCCTIRGDLVDTLRSLIVRRSRGEIPAFDRLVVETTGLADPAPILHTLMADPFLITRYRLDGVVSTVDAVNGAATLDNHMEAVKQAAVADRIVVTKVDVAGLEQVRELTERLGQLNPGARMVQASHGEIDPAQLFDAGLYDPASKSLDVQRWLNEQAYADEAAHERAPHAHDRAEHGHGHADGTGHGHADDGGAHGHAHDVNRHDERISAYCVRFDEPLEWDKVAAWLELLATYRGEDMLRVKGILNVKESDRPVVIHGVQHLFHPPVQLPAWPDDDRQSRIVFITRDMPRDVVEGMLTALEGRRVSHA